MKNTILYIINVCIIYIQIIYRYNITINSVGNIENYIYKFIENGISKINISSHK